MDSQHQRAVIEHIRREKFGIGSTASNPLAGMLHEAIAHLSAELYQKDMHFISELLQNAEDNSYLPEVIPSVEMVLTKEDIACVGARSTLVLFNNEVGFQINHVEALCGVGHSTKKGKRDSGYIGEKGIGFKSVFLVSRCPYVISNGYRIRFAKNASTQTKIGYVVPEWSEVPTDATLRRVFGKQQLPATVIVLPLRSDKVEVVREQLKHISPETLLFLSRIRQLAIREHGGDLRMCMSRSDLLVTAKDTMCKSLTVNVSVGNIITQCSEETPYFLVQTMFPVTHPVEQRKEVKNWTITLAFPFLERKNTGRVNGDIYAFLPSALVSGFPFIVNADFLLVSSRETLKFDSPWNVGILSCIPDAFAIAFNLILRKSSDAPAIAVQHAYKYIPINIPQCTQLRDVQWRIVERLARSDVVLVDSFLGQSPPIPAKQLCRPKVGRTIDPIFRSILRRAMRESNPNPVLGKGCRFHVVDRDVQDRYPRTLEALGVTAMTELEYVECLKSSDWLLGLSDSLYWDVVHFGLTTVRRSSPGRRSYLYPYMAVVDKIPLLKYLTEDGSVALASYSEVKSGSLKIFISASEQGGWLSQWTLAFKTWVPIYFMPKTTGKAFTKLLENEASKYSWAFLTSVVSDLSVKVYLRQLLSYVLASQDSKFVMMGTRFTFRCFQAKYLEMNDISDIFNKDFPLVDESGVILRAKNLTSQHIILLPSTGSMWPQLKLSSWYPLTTPLSNNYLPVSKSDLSGQKEVDGLQLPPFRLFLRSVFGAMDLLHVAPPKEVPMPASVISEMTSKEAWLLLQWLALSLPQMVMEKAGNVFLDRLKVVRWIQTENNGLQLPSDCFWKDTFSAFFTASDVPYVVPGLATPFETVLAELGVRMDVSTGSDAVAKRLLQISADPVSTRDCNVVQATRFYTFLQQFLWKPTLVDDVDSNKSPVPLKMIFVPGSTEKNTPNCWRYSESCVIVGSVDGLFDESLTVLKELYPQSLLPFFSDVLKVPKKATVEKYCQLWMTWMADGRDVSVEQCAKVWKVISKKWKRCDENVWKTFLDQPWLHWVPSVAQTGGELQLSSPNSCLIPDDVHLCSLFSACPKMPNFVWYPDSSEKTECLLNELYASLGVKTLSQCVETEVTVPKTISSAGKSRKRGRGEKRNLKGNGIICKGLCRAVLGFLTTKKYQLSSSQRKEIVQPLKKALAVVIRNPFSRSYTISLPSIDFSPIVVIQNNVMAHWSRAEGKFYCLDEEGKILIDKSSLIWREFRTQVATTLANGLLSNHHPFIVDELVDFLISLVDSGFATSAVDYELMRKKTKFYEEDEAVVLPNLGQLQSGKRKTTSKNKKQSLCKPVKVMCTRSSDRRTRNSSRRTK